MASAVGLMVRERLTGEAPPEAARAGLGFVSDWIEEKAGADLDALGLALDDQAAFAALATKLLRDLELVEGEPRTAIRSRRGRRGRGRRRGRRRRRRRGATSDEGGGRGEAEIRGEQEEGGDEEGESDWSEEEMVETRRTGSARKARRACLPVRPNRPLSDLPPQFRLSHLHHPI